MPLSLNLAGVFSDAIAEHLAIIRRLPAQHDAFRACCGTSLRLPASRTQSHLVRQWRQRRRRAAPGRRTGRPLPASALGAGFHRAHHRLVGAHGARQRLWLRASLRTADRGAVHAGRCCGRHLHLGQEWQRLRRPATGARTRRDDRRHDWQASADGSAGWPTFACTYPQPILRVFRRGTSCWDTCCASGSTLRCPRISQFENAGVLPMISDCVRSWPWSSRAGATSRCWSSAT